MRTSVLKILDVVQRKEMGDLPSFKIGIKDASFQRVGDDIQPDRQIKKVSEGAKSVKAEVLQMDVRDPIWASRCRRDGAPDGLSVVNL